MSTRDQRREFRVGIGRLGLAGFILMAMPVHGAIFNWTNTTSGAASWSTSGNWLEGAAPAIGGATDVEIRIYTNSTMVLPNSAAIVAANDLGSGSPAAFALNILTLYGKGPASGNGTVTISGANLMCTNNAGTLPLVNLYGTSNTASLAYQIANNVILADDTTFKGAGTASFAFSGVVSGSGSLIKTNTSILTLTGANTYTGATVIQLAGNNIYSVLEANDGVGLPTTSRLQFAEGTLQSIGSVPQTFTRSLGSAPGQVQWTTNCSGGFAANGAKLTVNIGGNPTPSTLTWKSADFLPTNSGRLLFGSLTATAEVEFRNGLNLNGSSSSRIINVVDNPNSGTDFATISGVISSANGVLEVAGGGTLKLTATNTYTGGTAVGGASTLEAVDGVGLPTVSKLQINGGMLQTRGLFNRSFASPNTVYWTSGGGFSAAGGKLTVTFVNAPSPLVWGATPNFVTAGSGLYFGSQTSDSEVEFTHNIDLNNAQRTIKVFDNLFTNTDLATFSGVISSSTSAGGISLNSGNSGESGTLRLTGTNTYSGTNILYQGVLEAIDGIGLPTNSFLKFSANTMAVFQSTGMFTRVLGAGTGPNQVQFPNGANGGFSAGAGKLTVNLNGNTPADLLIFGSTPNFFQAGYKLGFGSINSGAEVEFQNGINCNNGTLLVQVDDNPSTSTDYATISGILTNGSLTKSGLGLLRLSATNSLRNTIINSGTILVDGLFSVNNSYSVTVNSGGALGGTGTVMQVINVASNGTIMGGRAGVVGTLTTTNLTLAEGAVVACDLAGSTADLIAVNGKLTLPSNATVRLNYTGSLPASMTLFSATSLAGATNSSVLSGWTLVPASTRSFMIQGNSVVLSPRRGSVISLQ